MSNIVKDINIKNHTCYFFDDVINIKDFRSKKYQNRWIAIQKYSYFIHCIRNYQRFIVKINSVNPLYLVLNKMNGYFEEINRNKYLTLVPTNESKEKIKKYEELRI